MEKNHFQKYVVRKFIFWGNSDPLLAWEEYISLGLHVPLIPDYIRFLLILKSQDLYEFSSIND